MDYNATTAVETGAKLLDEKRPGWEAEIGILALDLRQLHKCILGQLYGDYGVGVRELLPEASFWDGTMRSEVVKHGFFAPDWWNLGDETDRNLWGELQAAWVAEIAGRRQMATV